MFLRTANVRLVGSVFRAMALGPSNRRAVTPIFAVSTPRRGYAAKQTKLSTSFADLEKERIQLVLDLQSVYNNHTMPPKVKSKRLKAQLFQLIAILPENEFKRSQLPMANSVINFIDQTPNPSDSFTSQEMLTLLRSVLAGMTVDDVKYVDFFPRFYNCLRKSSDYNDTLDIRLQLFEIFINYILLSNKRESVVKVIDAFIDDEVNYHNHTPNDEIVNIVLEAFKEITPDTHTMIKITQLVSKEALLKQETLDSILETFFRAADEEISQGFEDNSVSERIILLLDQLESKVTDPLNPYIELLYFATKNNFENVSQGILGKLERISNGFTNEKYLDVFTGEVLFALVGSALSFGKSDSAKTLIGLLSRRDKAELTEEEWMALLQWKSFENHEYKPAIDIVTEINAELESLQKDYSFEDTDSYNQVLEALCWSKKSFDYIDKFTQDFESHFGLQPDAKSVATLFNYLISIKDLSNATAVFMQNKDRVDWEGEYDGFYVLSLFNLVASVWKSPNINWNLKMDVYKNVKRYEYIFDKKSVYTMIKASFDFNEPALGILVMLDQLPDVKKGSQKLPTEKYKDIFGLIYEYLLTSKDGELNCRVYRYLFDSFDISYDYYPGLVKMFIDSERPDMALRVFADMKALSKEKKLPPPSEDFYIYLFKAFGRFQYEDGVFKLHLSMKMDLSINLDVKLLNSLMEGYAGLEDPFKTRDVFNLAFSLPKDHGLNNESAYWMLKSLKYATLGHVSDFYNGLSGYDVLPDPNLFAEYLIANCYFEQYRTALDTLIDTNEKGDPELINDHVLKTLHNNCLHEGVRKDLEKYATKCFPETWQRLKDTNQLTVNDDYPDLLKSPYGEASIEIKRISGN